MIFAVLLAAVACWWFYEEDGWRGLLLTAVIASAVLFGLASRADAATHRAPISAGDALRTALFPRIVAAAYELPGRGALVVDVRCRRMSSRHAACDWRIVGRTRLGQRVAEIDGTANVVGRRVSILDYDPHATRRGL